MNSDGLECKPSGISPRVNVIASRIVYIRSRNR